MKAIVLDKKKDRFLVEVIPDPKCGGCKACARSQGGKVFLVKGEKEYEKGAFVELAIEDSKLLAASFLAYGVPLIVFFGSLFALYMLLSNSTLAPFAEPISFFGALSVLALTYLIIHRTDAKRTEEGRFEARIVKEVKEELCHLS